MKIGIIVYSQTGNTYSVAEKIKNALKGHNVTIERIEGKKAEKQFPPTADLTKAPNIDKYDAIIFASFVEAFSLNPVMKTYLMQLKTLKSKKIAVFVTKGLPFIWTGGRRAIKQMQRICSTKDNNVTKTGIIYWGSKERDKNIKQLVKEFVKYFNNDK